MSKPKSQHILVEMKYLDEYSQRELTAYRNLGSVRDLRVLKYKETERRRRREHIQQTIGLILSAALFGAVFALTLCIAVLIS